MFSLSQAQPTFRILMVRRLLLLTLVSVLVISLWGARFLGRQMTSAGEEHLRELALRVRDGLESYLTLHRAAVETAAARGRVGTLTGTFTGAEAGRILDETAAIYPGFLTMSITDGDGRMIRAVRRGGESFAPGTGKDQSVQDREYFQRPRQTGRSYLSGVFRGRGLGRDAIVAVSAPMIDRRGKFLGVVQGSIDIARIPIQLKNAAGSPMVVAVDGAGRVVYSSAPAVHAPLERFAPTAWQQQEGERFSLPDPQQAGEEHYAVQYGLAMAGWRIVAMMPASQFNREAHDFFRLTALMMLLLMGLAWRAARLMAQSVSMPLVTMARQMEEYDLSAPARYPGEAERYAARELNQIQAAFLRMGERWQAALRERDEVLRNLDRQVGERTRELAESETRYRQMVEYSGDLILRTDAAGRVTFSNAAVEKLLGEGLVGRSLFEQVDLPTRAEIRRQVREQVRTRTPAIFLEFALQPESGPAIWIGQSNQLLLDERGRVTGFQAIARDITVQKVAERALREAEERYALAVKGSNNGIWDWDLRSGKVYYSERWKQMLGWDESAVGDQLEDWFRWVHPSDARDLRRDLDGYVEAGEGLFEAEHRMRHADGTWRWVLTCGAAVRSESGVALRVAGSTSDVTDGKLVDALTGLPNRLAIVERLDRLIARRKEDASREFALLFMDLDRFKLINDSLGHLKGDHLLLGVSRRLANALEQQLDVAGCVGRLGGDEFVIVLDDAATAEVAVRMAQAVIEEMKAPMHIDGGLIFTSTSIGIAHSGTGMRSTEDALRNADTAMYQAKAESHGKYRLFDGSMHARAIQRLELETDLRQALEAGEFVLHYQPQVNLRTGRLAGFEALVRWNHPRRGLLAPVEFIRIAEENRLILPLGRWVLENGCRQLAAWSREEPAASELTMSINLSALQFNDQGLIAGVAAILEETGLPPARLHLEVTESMVADDPEVAQSILHALSEMGIGLEVDDFGTGYSCLSQLHQLPFDTLKVDRSFVQAMDREVDGRKVVESIVTLSANLGINVIAEGIETAEHWQQLARMGCELGQGYYFSRPVNAEEALRMAARRSREPWPLPASLTASTVELARLQESLAGVFPVAATTE